MHRAKNFRFIKHRPCLRLVRNYGCSPLPRGKWESPRCDEIRSNAIHLPCNYPKQVTENCYRLTQSWMRPDWLLEMVAVQIAIVCFLHYLVLVSIFVSLPTHHRTCHRCVWIALTWIFIMETHGRVIYEWDLLVSYSKLRCLLLKYYRQEVVDCGDYLSRFLYLQLIGPQRRCCVSAGNLPGSSSYYSLWCYGFLYSWDSFVLEPLKLAYPWYRFQPPILIPHMQR